MPSYGVSIQDTASDTLQRLITAVKGREYTTPVGEAGKGVLMTHFAAKNADPKSHRTAMGFGAAPTDLYAEFAQSTSWQPSFAGVTLSVDHVAARQRLEGGTIKPVNSTYLTIPARSESYGKRAREFGETLMVLFGRNGPYALAAKADHMRTLRRGPRAGQLVPVRGEEKGTAGAGGVYFFLVSESTQPPDPTVLPDNEKLFKGIEASLGTWLDRLLGRN